MNYNGRYPLFFWKATNDIEFRCTVQYKGCNRERTRTGLIWHTSESNDGPLSRNTFHKSGGLWTAKLLKTAYPRNEVDELVSLFHILDITG